jgi:hypothetical protein
LTAVDEDSFQSDSLKGGAQSKFGPVGPEVQIDDAKFKAKNGSKVEAHRPAAVQSVVEGPVGIKMDAKPLVVTSSLKIVGEPHSDAQGSILQSSISAETFRIIFLPIIFTKYLPKTTDPNLPV